MASGLKLLGGYALFGWFDKNGQFFLPKEHQGSPTVSLFGFNKHASQRVVCNHGEEVWGCKLKSLFGADTWMHIKVIVLVVFRPVWDLPVFFIPSA